MSSNLSNIASYDTSITSEDASPNPEYLIKSIAEQGYSFETALADLMDNSISATASKIEVLVDFESEPIKLFVADNGEGMSERELSENMQFPSKSPESNRLKEDLGRFGLGLKTASFSQTRKFTVLSRKKGEKNFHGRTWDIDFLKANGWKIIINTEEEINNLLLEYSTLSKELNKQFEHYEANTIVIWNGLYKFELYLDEINGKNALKREIEEVTSEHLALVFHRFMQRAKNPLQVRINNALIKPFDPFPPDIRGLDPIQSQFKSDIITIEGFVLPSKAIGESKKGITQWTTRHRSLMDMEGIYIYRENRIILFGGWMGLIKKSSRLQLARLKVEVGNGVDNLLHLNVAKSQIAIPYELRKAFEDYIDQLKEQAEKEFYNRDLKKFSGKKTADNANLFERTNTNKGAILEVNNQFPLIKSLTDNLNNEQLSKFKLILRMINTRINNIRQVHEDKEFIGITEKDGLTVEDVKSNVLQLLELGLTPEIIKREIISHLGFEYSSLPEEIKTLLST